MSAVVVIFGATGGLGSAIARAYAKRGAQLVLVGRRIERVEALVQEIGTDALALSADVHDPGSIDAVAQACVRQFGRVDVVVNATGCDVRRKFLDHDVDETRQLIDTNLLGAVWITRGFLPVMQTQKSGVIAHLGGFADGRLVFPYYSVDAASRAGLRGLVDSLNREIEGSGVTITYFCPAPADTDAERPYHHIWRAMGTAIVPPEAVADALIRAVDGRKRVYVMGASTRLFAWINSLSSSLADILLMRHYRRLLERMLIKAQ